MVTKTDQSQKTHRGICFDRPCRETGMDGFGHQPAVGFLFLTVVLLDKYYFIWEAKKKRRVKKVLIPK